MSPQYITITTDGSIGRITLNRPDLHNAFNDDMMKELTAAFEDMGQGSHVRVVILAAEGKSFCAGADVHWMKRMVDYSFEENVADATLLHQMLKTIRDCPKPVIVRIQGAAYGGGVGLIAACDLAVAVELATFSLSEVKLGIVPAVISPFVLEKMDLGAVRRYALTAERFSAAEAKRIGLVSEMTSTTEEMDRWIDEIMQHLLRNSPQALTMCKQILGDVIGLDWNHLRTYTARQIAEIRVSPQGQDGLKAFLEKRPPQWIIDR